MEEPRPSGYSSRSTLPHGVPDEIHHRLEALSRLWLAPNGEPLPDHSTIHWLLFFLHVMYRRCETVLNQNGLELNEHHYPIFMRYHHSLRDAVRQTRRLLNDHPELPHHELAAMLQSLDDLLEVFAVAEGVLERKEARKVAVKSIEMAEMSISESRSTIACE